MLQRYSPVGFFGFWNSIKLINYLAVVVLAYHLGSVTCILMESAMCDEESCGTLAVQG